MPPSFPVISLHLPSFQFISLALSFMSLRFPCSSPACLVPFPFISPLCLLHFPFMSAAFPIMSLHLPSLLVPFPFISLSFPPCPFHFPLMSCHFRFLPLHVLAFPCMSPSFPPAFPAHFPFMSIHFRALPPKFPGHFPSIPSCPCHAPFHFPAQLCISAHFPFMSPLFPPRFLFVSLRFPFISYVIDVSRTRRVVLLYPLLSIQTRLHNVGGERGFPLTSCNAQVFLLQGAPEDFLPFHGQDGRSVELENCTAKDVAGDDLDSGTWTGVLAKAKAPLALTRNRPPVERKMGFQDFVRFHVGVGQH